MKRTLSWLPLFMTFVLCVAGPLMFGQETEEHKFSREGRSYEERLQGERLPARQVKKQGLQGYYGTSPLRDITPEIIRATIAAGITTTIPLFNYTIIGYEGITYSGVMVGRSPFAHGARMTNVQAYLVPLEFIMPDGGDFDSTVADPACSPSGTALALVQGSPILTATSITMNQINVGTTQYVDAFERASFWSDVSVSGDRYHTMINPVTILSKVIITVPMGSGQTWPASMFGGCGKIGVIDLNYWDPWLIGGTSHGEAGALLAQLSAQGVGPTNFPIFLMSNVVFAKSGTNPTTNCCTLGYHGAIGPLTSLQTYSPLDYDTTGIPGLGKDISIMTHEIGEWMDDPLGTNMVPVWGALGQQPNCQNNLEVGDPLTGTLFPPVGPMPNGMTYHPQELAFFSWFYGGVSLGAGGKYSNNGTFTGFANACPPGGTH